MFLFDLGIENEGTPDYPRVRRLKTAKKAHQSNVPLGIIESADKAEELVSQKNLPGMVAALRKHDRSGHEYWFNAYFQACVNARWIRPLQEFAKTAKFHKAVVQFILSDKRRTLIGADSSKLITLNICSLKPAIANQSQSRQPMHA